MHLSFRSLVAGGFLFASLSGAARAELDAHTLDRVAACSPTVGDIVFIRTGGPIFTRVALTTLSWTSHVGIIVDYRDGDWVVAESGIPFVRKTPLRKFLNRSVDGKFSIRRLKTGATDEQKREMLAFADSQMGKLYSLGFDLDSKDTFCSKFVHDDVYAATHQSLGEVETFDHLLHRNPDAPMTFWKAWFLGSIPWSRRTITPASELQSPLLSPVAENNL